MHAAACVYDFVYRDLVLITRRQIHHSIFVYSIFVIFHPFRRSHFVSNRRLSYARRGVRLRFCLPGFGSYNPSPNSTFIIRYSIFDIFHPFRLRISCQTGVYRMHAAACVYDFVYRDLVLITRRQIHHSLFDIRYSIFDIFHPFCRSCEFGVHRMHAAACGLRFCLPGFGCYHPSPNSSFVIRYSISPQSFNLFLSPFVSNRHLSYARRGVRLRFCLPNFVSYLL